MNKVSSGCYVIDSDYNIINANEPAKDIYPQLQVGKKCYTCLMGLKEPCGPCPVANGRKGPATYKDPIRNIAEIVDAVDIDIDGVGRCHALVFSTVDNEAEFAATLPTTAEDLKNLSLIKALTAEYFDVFSVKLSDGTITLYRHNGLPLNADSIYRQIISYEQGTEDYIANHVLEEDREMMREQCRLNVLQAALAHSETVIIHYRVMWQDEIHYFCRKVVRVGDPDSFENIIVGVYCEDEEVANREKHLTLAQNLRKVEYSTSTGLLTKEAFFIYGNQLLNDNPNLNYDFCILRLQNLGSINHQYGRLTGEKTVQLIGQILKTYETGQNCIAYFGDGIYGSLTETTSTEYRTQVIHQFQDKILELSDIKNLTLRWSLYKAIRRDLPIESIYEQVSYALTTIRSTMTQEYVEFDQTMLDRLEWDQFVESNFKKALADGEFEAWYQPKYSVHTKEIVGAEALVRWKRANGEIISPDKFIPVLENTGLIKQLDAEIFRQVCETERTITTLGLKNIAISVNLSRASIFTNDIAQSYAEIAKAYHVAPHLIPIEITESAAIRAEMIGEFAASLIQKNFVLHMDDFGAGYSSLASLHAIPFESIKLDKTLVDFIGTVNGENLLKHTIAFAKESHMSVIAEGVENVEQYYFLKIAGCDFIQGYYFSKPLPKNEFLRKLQNLAEA